MSARDPWWWAPAQWVVWALTLLAIGGWVVTMYGPEPPWEWAYPYVDMATGVDTASGRGSGE